MIINTTSRTFLYHRIAHWVVYIHSKIHHLPLRSDRKSPIINAMYYHKIIQILHFRQILWENDDSYRDENTLYPPTLPHAVHESRLPVSWILELVFLKKELQLFNSRGYGANHGQNTQCCWTI